MLNVFRYRSHRGFDNLNDVFAHALDVSARARNSKQNQACGPARFKELGLAALGSQADFRHVREVNDFSRRGGDYNAIEVFNAAHRSRHLNLNLANSDGHGATAVFTERSTN